jgi:hypothetical protein
MNDQNDPYTKNIPVIFMTAIIQKDEVEAEAAR